MSYLIVSDSMTSASRHTNIFVASQVAVEREVSIEHETSGGELVIGDNPQHISVDLGVGH